MNSNKVGFLSHHRFIIPGVEPIADINSAVGPFGGQR